MGRPGMKKAFLKSANRKPGAPADEAEGSGSEDEQPAAAKPPPSPKKAAAASAAPAAAPSAAAGSDEEGGGGDEGPETRGRMVQRHKREAVALKKRAKGSKAEAAKAMADLDARHAKELADLERRDREGGGAAGPSSSSAAAAAAPKAAPAAAKAAAAAAAATAAAVDGASKYLKDATLDDDADGEPAPAGRKQTKAQKRREKAAAKESERDARIAAELAALGPTERAQEKKALARLLLPLGLAVKDVRADGNCMYHSVADQLEQHPSSSAAAKEGEGGADGGEDAGGNGACAGAAFDFLSLRRLAAAHMRRHRADFEPFVAEGAAALPRGPSGAGGKDDGDDDDDDEEKEDGDAFEAYVAAVEATSAWGGHVELTALAGALRRRIRVVAAGMPEVWAGEEHPGEPLTVCYVRHEFGLGEHYNSVKPRDFPTGEEEDEEEGEGGGGGASGRASGDE